METGLELFIVNEVFAGESVLVELCGAQVWVSSLNVFCPEREAVLSSSTLWGVGVACNSARLRDEDCVLVECSKRSVAAALTNRSSVYKKVCCAFALLILFPRVK